ncbi:stage III sporulation protein AB [Clostridium gasigenes]|uniref:stage III sporulation protein AB n=1 Tax=Clostridium gasigenes TaxID=94869 RepID=UPI001C0DD1AD|nr:stage III sporulation protein AB [Clostridium gasigenes]MBU3106606.1 stage III sporulation protein AB [Clostridium gasigenes]
MLKMISIGIIFCASTYIGFYHGEKFKGRYRDLNDILNSLLILNNEVIYGNTPVPQALHYVSEKTSCHLRNLLLRVSEKLINGESKTVYHAFKDEYRKMKEDFFIIEEDEKILSDFTRELGESGVFGQDKIFNLTIENIKLNCKKSETIANKNTKMYRSLGICVGAMLAVFLM